MDFTPDEETRTVADLAREIFTDQLAGRPTEVADSRLHAALGRAGLLGLHLPESDGGAGLGIAQTAAVLEEQGRAAAGAPLWAGFAASYAVATYADAPARARLLPSVLAGTAMLAFAGEEYGGPPLGPRAEVHPDGATWRVSGLKAAVPVAGDPAAVVVTARGPEGPVLLLLDAHAPGVAWESTPVTDTAPSADLHLDGVEATPLGGADAHRDVLEFATAAVVATQLGVMEGALALAASHVSAREQFGRPLATFQAVQHRLADCYIDVEATRVTLQQALSDITEQAPGRAASVPVAHWWASRAGMDLVHRTQHLHGGTGVDRDFPAHRYYLLARQLAGTLGGEHETLAQLGDVIAQGVVA